MNAHINTFMEGRSRFMNLKGVVLLDHGERSYSPGGFYSILGTMCGRFHDSGVAGDGP